MTRWELVPDAVHLDEYPDLRSALAASELPLPVRWKLLQGCADPSHPAGLLKSLSPEYPPSKPYVISRSEAGPLQGDPPWLASGLLKACIQQSAVIDRDLHRTLLRLFRPEDAASLLILNQDEARELCDLNPESVLFLPRHLQELSPFLQLVDRGHYLTASKIPAAMLAEVRARAHEVNSRSLVFLGNWSQWEGPLPDRCWSDLQESDRDKLRMPRREESPALTNNEIMAWCRNRDTVEFGRAISMAKSRRLIAGAEDLVAMLDRNFADARLAAPTIVVSRFHRFRNSDERDFFNDALQKYSAWAIASYREVSRSMHEEAILRINPDTVEKWMSYAGMSAFASLMMRYPAPEEAIQLAIQRLKSLEALPVGCWNSARINTLLSVLPGPSKGNDTRLQFQTALKHPALNQIDPEVLARVLRIAVDAPTILTRSLALQQSLLPGTPGRAAVQEVLALNPPLVQALTRCKALPKPPVAHKPTALEQEFSL